MLLLTVNLHVGLLDTWLRTMSAATAFSWENNLHILIAAEAAQTVSPCSSCVASPNTLSPPSQPHSSTASRRRSHHLQHHLRGSATAATSGGCGGGSGSSSSVVAGADKLLLLIGVSSCLWGFFIVLMRVTFWTCFCYFGSCRTQVCY